MNKLQKKFVSLQPTNQLYSNYKKGKQMKKCLISFVAVAERWEDKLGGKVRDHILNSAKFE